MGDEHPAIAALSAALAGVDGSLADLQSPAETAAARVEGCLSAFTSTAAPPPAAPRVEIDLLALAEATLAIVRSSIADGAALDSTSLWSIDDIILTKSDIIEATETGLGDDVVVDDRSSRHRVDSVTRDGH